MSTEFVIVFVTTSSIQQARAITQVLLERKKAACVNIAAGISSSFLWQNKIEQAEENLLIIKTKAVLLDDVIALVKQHHEYEVPEIIALPVAGGSTEYLQWLDESLR